MFSSLSDHKFATAQSMKDRRCVKLIFAQCEPRTSLAPTGPNANLVSADELEKERQKLQDDVDDFKYYPCYLLVSLIDSSDRTGLNTAISSANISTFVVFARTG